MSELGDIVVCSLEAWDDVWRRNQFFAERLLRRHPDMQILFVEPPADPLYDLASRRRPTLARLRSIRPDGRLRAFRPLKPLPRRAGPIVDWSLRGQAVLAARSLRLSRPMLWLNDVTYAPLIRQTGWPTVYDVTDDWLQAPVSAREHDRLVSLDALALAEADEVVVCSPELARTRGAAREVTLVPNAVDADHFRRPRERPTDLPRAPVAVYVGSLHDSRFDVALVVQLARTLETLAIALVGPDSLSAGARAALSAEPRIHLLGPRPYEIVPAYLQHADVVIVPHLVNAFTDSLDPIKAYECLAVATPTVATPVAGFRVLDGALAVAGRERFVAAVLAALDGERGRAETTTLPTWDERAEAFGAALQRAVSAHGVERTGRARPTR